jgi:Ca-activated chloride channel family protein
MSFLAPAWLWLLLIVGALGVIYVSVQHRRGTYALRFSDTGLLDTVAPKRPGWRRHVVAMIFLSVAALMIVSLADPVTEEEVPRERAVVMLTIDTSLSMGASDVNPTRIDAAKEAAITFLNNAPTGIDVGLISFHETPIVQVPPTANRASVIEAVQKLELGPFTNTGDAISASINSLERTLDGLVFDEGGPPPTVVVLLSDGEPTVGRPIETAIAEAILARIPVATVALGTALGEVEVEDPDFPGRFEIVPVPVNEDSLRLVAELTGGSFFATSSPEELAAVYNDIGTAIGVELVDRDISDRFVILALGAAFLTALLSLSWFQRLP